MTEVRRARGLLRSSPMRSFLALALLCACGSVTGPLTLDGGSDDSDASIDADTSAAALTLSPSAHDFASIGIGSTSGLEMLQLENTGTAAAEFGLRLEGTDADQFVIAQSTCTNTLEPGTSCTIAVALQPTREGALSGRLAVVTGSNVVADTTLQGIGVVAGVRIEPSLDSFGNIRLATTADRTFLIRNTSTVQIPAPVATLAGAAAYTVQASDCTGPLVPDASCSYTIRYAPSSIGAHNATISVGAATAQIAGAGAAEVVVTRSGPGSVAGSGIDCGASCTTLVTSSPITLSATNAAGATFSGWTGAAAGCASNATCNVDITSGMVALGAQFADIPTVTLRVINVTDSQGTVTIQPSDTTCGTPGAIDTCVVDLQAASVTFTVQNDCSKVRTWSGACSGAGLSCTIPLTGDVSATLEFQLGFCQ